jgi:nicotinate-nucleotide--dimethylbenzimidazole phosphoribosyltransferase
MAFAASPKGMMDTGNDFARALRAKIDNKTKPLGALGRIETLAADIARLQQTLSPKMVNCRLILFAGDHGIAAQGVSAYPQAVTRQMVANILAGGAASTVLARALGVAVSVVDCGVVGEPVRNPALIDRRLGEGTDDSSMGPAMSEAVCRKALENGAGLVHDADADAFCFGEMGIANSSAAALVCGKVLGLDTAMIAGRGTGLDDAGLVAKRAVLNRAASRTAARLSGVQALTEYGGFEIATMAGAMLAAARSRRLVLVDGFIAGAAAAAALDIDPTIRGALVFAHRSAEAGHALVLETLGAEPLLALGLRLGEGSGALLAWPLVQAAAAMLNDMASFEGAGVSGPA